MKQTIVKTKETNKWKYSKIYLFIYLLKKLKRRNKIESKQKRKAIYNDEKKTYVKENVICFVSSNFKLTSKEINFQK
jgi:hypothetical protein